MAALVHKHPFEARRRLADLGVSLEAIVSSVRAGHLARLSCTNNDPPFIPGTEAWRFVVRTLREELLSKGFRKADPANYSLVISDARKINIVVATGDVIAGQPYGSPRTKSIKGLYTEAAIARNNVEADLFPETLAEEVRRVASSLEYPTWILLIYITDDEVRAELSQPAEMDDGQIISWSERILIPFDEPGAGAACDSDASPDPDIDIPVRRKAK